ncbi:PadR family transcriptional regulator [Bengtsoniella intestinalis]|uniref:PadR family transcriptional regulator n=1 Tax=Bengtsoniella intestinalis TaxID=3073143 RepID=UPI00391F959B
MAKSMEHTKLLVLALLSKGDMYGYEMIAQLERQFDKTFAMKEGTLYPVLKSLQNEGALTAYTQETPSGRTRKYYHLTEAGVRVLEAETKQWEVYSKGINAVVAGAVYG